MKLENAPGFIGSLMCLVFQAMAAMKAMKPTEHSSSGWARWKGWKGSALARFNKPTGPLFSDHSFFLFAQLAQGLFLSCF